MLDHNAGFVLSAYGITLVVLVTYALYLRARLRALRQGVQPVEDSEEEGYSGRNVSAAAPTPTTAQAASSANGPTAA